MAIFIGIHLNNLGIVAGIREDRGLVYRPEAAMPFLFERRRIMEKQKRTEGEIAVHDAQFKVEMVADELGMLLDVLKRRSCRDLSTIPEFSSGVVRNALEWLDVALKELSSATGKEHVPLNIE